MSTASPMNSFTKEPAGGDDSTELIVASGEDCLDDNEAREVKEDVAGLCIERVLDGVCGDALKALLVGVRRELLLDLAGSKTSTILLGVKGVALAECRRGLIDLAGIETSSVLLGVDSNRLIPGEKGVV